MENIRLTVVVPVYNAEHYIAACAESVLSQGVDGVELLFVDDGSTDGGGSVLDAIAAREPAMRVIHQPNGGVSSARNRGIREARGEWLTFLDADDAFLPAGLQRLLSLTEERADGVCGGVTRIKTNAGQTAKVQRFLTKEPMTAALRAALENPTRYLTCHGWLLRTQTMRDADLLFREELTMGEDGEMILRFLRYARGVIFTEQPVYRYTLRRESAVHRYRADMAERYLQTLEAAAADVPEEALADSLAVYQLTHLLLIITHGVFHPANPASVRETWQQAERLCGRLVFRNAFRRAAWNRLGPAKRLTLWCLRRGLTPAAWLLVRIRQRYNAFGSV